jgi:hypothetical protein
MRRTLIITVLLLAVAGCAEQSWMPVWGPPPAWIPAPPQPIAQNPLLVPVTDGNYVFEQVVDVVDDFFQIAREERVKQVGDILTEGRIDTLPSTSPTVLEPWKADSATGYDRLENTLQSIRRTAAVRVIPTQGGYLVDVDVEKELEDYVDPKRGSKGTAVFQHATTLDRNVDTLVNEQPTRQWIKLGRDPALEYQILAELQVRLAEAGAAQGRPLR